MKDSLNKKGLSLSQAQSVSNLCFQRAKEIENRLSNLNNASKTLLFGDKTLIETKGNPIPEDVSKLLLEKAMLHATQAFLMENMKAKTTKLESIRKEQFVFNEAMPERQDREKPTLLPNVDGTWGMEQLTVQEANEWLFNEAHAAHIGQFIHKGSTLERLRDELPTLKTLEWIEVETGKKTPLEIKVHHTSEDLLKIHEQLADLHRGYEQRVNYFKAKVNNLVTLENARIAKVNADEQNRVNEINNSIDTTYAMEYNAWLGRQRKDAQEFEAGRNTRMKETSELRIEVSPLFKPTIDGFLKVLGEEEDK